MDLAMWLCWPLGWSTYKLTPDQMNALSSSELTTPSFQSLQKGKKKNYYWCSASVRVDSFRNRWTWLSQEFTGCNSYKTWIELQNNLAVKLLVPPLLSVVDYNLLVLKKHLIATMLTEPMVGTWIDVLSVFHTQEAIHADAAARSICKKMQPVTARDLTSDTYSNHHTGIS